MGLYKTTELNIIFLVKGCICILKCFFLQINCHEKVEDVCSEEAVEECAVLPEIKCQSRSRTVCEDLTQILCH